MSISLTYSGCPETSRWFNEVRPSEIFAQTARTVWAIRPSGLDIFDLPTLFSQLDTCVASENAFELSKAADSAQTDHLFLWFLPLKLSPKALIFLTSPWLPNLIWRCSWAQNSIPLTRKVFTAAWWSICTEQNFRSVDSAQISGFPTVFSTSLESTKIITRWR